LQIICLFHQRRLGRGRCASYGNYENSYMTLARRCFSKSHFPITVIRNVIMDKNKKTYLENNIADGDLVEIYETLRFAQLRPIERSQILDTILKKHTIEGDQDEIDFGKIVQLIRKQNRFSLGIDRYLTWVREHKHTLHTMISYIPVVATVLIIALICMAFYFESGWAAREAAMGALVIFLMLVIFCTSRAWRDRQAPAGKQKLKKPFTMLLGLMRPHEGFVGCIAGVFLCMFLIVPLINMKNDDGNIRVCVPIENGQIDLRHENKFSFSSPTKESSLTLARGNVTGKLLVTIKDSKGKMVAESINDTQLSSYVIPRVGRYDINFIQKTPFKGTDNQVIFWYLQTIGKVENERNKKELSD